MNKISDLIEIRNSGDYQRNNFDAFLKHISFSFKTPSIHIAGTNGKGSTASYITSILTNQGYKVGLFTSPTLTNINDDITINNEAISDSDLREIIEKYKNDILKFQLSEFEIETFVALLYFDLNKCDIAVIECGMGGETDATNVFEPILSIITSISLEHTRFLGSSICEITRNKLGITREKGTLLIGNLPEEAIDTIREFSKDYHIKLCRVSEPFNMSLTENGYYFDYLTFKRLHILSKASYSILDACLAIEAVNIINNLFPVEEINIFKGLESISMYLRFSILSKNPLIILDGAHNPEAMEEFKKSLQNLNISCPIHTIFACFKDKNLLGLLNNVGSFSDTVLLTSFDHVRARKKEDYFLFINDYEFVEDFIEAINKEISQYPEDAFVITGSLAFCATVMDSIKKGKINVLKK